jgi:hypothetical protein
MPRRVLAVARGPQGYMVKRLDRLGRLASTDLCSAITYLEPHLNTFGTKREQRNCFGSSRFRDMARKLASSKTRY